MGVPAEQLVGSLTEDERPAPGAGGEGDTEGGEDRPSRLRTRGEAMRLHRVGDLLGRHPPLGQIESEEVGRASGGYEVVGPFHPDGEKSERAGSCEGQREDRGIDASAEQHGRGIVGGRAVAQ